MSSRKYQLGQHFLRSPRFALFLIGHSNIRKHDLVIEIGAGSGVITSALPKRAKTVYAIEKDKETAEKLRQNLQKCQNVEIFEKDFKDFELPNEPYKVFSNPPFDESAKVFYKLLNLKNDNGTIREKNSRENPTRKFPKSIYLILQKQFALKLIPTDRHYTSQLGYILQKYYDVKIKYPLKKTDFTPPPAVDTVLLEAKLREPDPRQSKI